MKAPINSQLPKILLLFADDLGCYPSAYAKTLTKLRSQLIKELKVNNDPRLDDGEFDRQPFLSMKRE